MAHKNIGATTHTKHFQNFTPYFLLSFFKIQTKKPDNNKKNVEHNKEKNRKAPKTFRISLRVVVIGRIFQTIIPIEQLVVSTVKSQ